MITCQNCGNSNSGESNFCRFCGTKFLARQSNPEQEFNYAPPRPYAWKTDEFQTQTEPRKLPQGGPLSPTSAGVQPYQAAGLAGGYRCPRCGSSYLPVIERRISTAGWVVFSLLLVFTVIFFWVGLLMKEDVSVCPVCRNRIN
jgi:hypothetical protein